MVRTRASLATTRSGSVENRPDAMVCNTLDRGADVNATGEDGEPPLYLAA
jgi:hypothetical protein